MAARSACRRLGLCLLLSVLFAFPAHALPLIRDAEIEHTLKTISRPILETAGLNPDNVEIYIVNNDAVNAFVAGGANIFLHTGLLMALNDPNMLIGVIAHETAHIAGGHLARGSEQLKGAQLGTILGYVLGAAAVAAGGGDAGMAIITGTQNVVLRNMLAYTRGHEQAADQAALGYLDRMKISASGMSDTFTLLRRNERRAFGKPDPYLLTHPLSQSRIEHVRAHTEKSDIPEGTYPKEYDLPFQRMQAKLHAFLKLPPRTFARYPERDKSIPARLARAVAWYKIPELDKALAEVNSLTDEMPDDPYFYDLKGQILFENGRTDEAKQAYEKAVELAPDSPLLLVMLAEARIASGDKAELTRAIAEIRKANTMDRDNASAWRLLAKAQGMAGNPAEASLALAEESLILGNADDATYHVTRALKDLPVGSAARLRAEDVKRAATRMKEKEDS